MKKGSRQDYWRNSQPFIGIVFESFPSSWSSWLVAFKRLFLFQITTYASPVVMDHPTKMAWYWIFYSAFHLQQFSTGFATILRPFSGILHSVWIINGIMARLFERRYSVQANMYVCVLAFIRTYYIHTTCTVTPDTLQHSSVIHLWKQTLDHAFWQLHQAPFQQLNDASQRPSNHPSNRATSRPRAFWHWKPFSSRPWLFQLSRSGQLITNRLEWCRSLFPHRTRMKMNLAHNSLTRSLLATTSFTFWAIVSVRSSRAQFKHFGNTIVGLFPIPTLFWKWIVLLWTLYVRTSFDIMLLEEKPGADLKAFGMTKSRL